MGNDRGLISNVFSANNFVDENCNYLMKTEVNMQFIKSQIKRMTFQPYC